MRTERTLWLGATTVAIGILLLLIALETQPGSWYAHADGSGPTGLPGIPVHSIVVDPDDLQRLYLGTDLGVMVSIDGGRTWRTEETGFGPAVTMWLSLIRTPAGQQQLFAFTHGRGARRVTLR